MSKFGGLKLIQAIKRSNGWCNLFVYVETIGAKIHLSGNGWYKDLLDNATYLPKYMIVGRKIYNWKVNRNE